MESPLERKLVWTEKQLEQLRTENAALKEQVVKLESLVNRYSKGMRENLAEALKGQETIAQQAEATRLKDEALTVAEDFVDRHSEKWYASGQRDLQQIREALALQPSPEILEARDQRVAEDCAKVCDSEAVDIHNVPAAIVARRCAEAIRSPKVRA